MNRTVRNVGGLILSIILMVSMYGTYKGGTANVGRMLFQHMGQDVGKAFRAHHLNINPSLPWNNGSYAGSAKTENNRAFNYWHDIINRAHASGIDVGTPDNWVWNDSPYNYNGWNSNNAYHYNEATGTETGSMMDYSKPYVVPRFGREQVIFYAKGDTKSPAEQGAHEVSPTTPMKSEPNNGLLDLNY